MNDSQTITRMDRSEVEERALSFMNDLKRKGADEDTIGDVLLVAGLLVVAPLLVADGTEIDAFIEAFKERALKAISLAWAKMIRTVGNA